MYRSICIRWSCQFYVWLLKGVNISYLFLKIMYYLFIYVEKIFDEEVQVPQVFWYSIPSSSPATAHNQEFWAQAKTRCKLGTYQISYILSSTILVPSRNKCEESIHCHILTSLWLLSKCKMCRINSWHSPKI